MRLKRLLKFSLLVLVLASGITLLKSGTGLAFTPNDLIDDSVFDNTNTMSASDIDTWLNSNFPSSCISTNHGFSSVDPTGYSPTGGFTFGGPVSAGRVIYDSAKAYGLNPQVLLTTLQKEESLVAGDAGCSVLRYASAVGYGCPDGGTTYNYSGLSPAMYYISGSPVTSVSGTCVNGASRVGFSQQLIRAAWLLKFGEQRSEGNTGWDVQATNSPQPGDSWDNSDDPQTCYGGPMTQGYFKRCSTDSSTTYYDGYTTIDGQSTHMDSGATAALYWYTPHFSGNQNFDTIFQNWFGSTQFSASSITMHNISQPDGTPALGQTVTYVASFTNNLSGSITLDAVGIVGRLGNVNFGANRDFGWQGPVTLSAGQTQQFTFTTVVRDLGTIYVWPAINYQGIYVHYNNWGESVNSHIPNFSLTSPLSSSVPNPVAGQTATLSATIKNNEDQPILLDTLGLPVRFYGSYNYDTGWTSGVTIQPGATQVVSGSEFFDKPGPYTAWVSAQVGGQYISISPQLNVNTAKVAPNFQLTYIQTPDTTPALGEDVTIQFKLKNNLPIGITLDAVGVVGRYDNPYSGPNNDFGWVGPETFTAGQEKTYSFTTNISQVRNFYAWVAINYQGAYTHYNNWGFKLSPHLPNLTLSAPLTVNGGTQPAKGQTVPVTATIKNNEPNPIKFSAVGLPARYYGVYNYDATWQGPGTLAASGQSGDSVSLSGNVTFDKSGPYTLWASILIQGQYITIGSQKNINI